MLTALRLRTWAKGTLSAALCAGVLLTSCGDSPSASEVGSPPTTSRPHDTREFFVPEGQPAFDALEGATAYHGIHEGIRGAAGYRIEVPDDWNGILVMWAHGYRGSGPQLTVEDPRWIRAHLIERGYAWAASSYSANYYDVRAGVEDTNALALAFEELTGQAAPTKYFIVGISMGGHVTGAAIEEETLATAANRVVYAGAVPMCGVMGDVASRGIHYAYTIAANRLAGLPVQGIPIPDAAQRIAAIKGALWVDYGSDNSALTPEGERARNVMMHLSGGRRPVFSAVFESWQDVIFSRGFGDGTFSGIFGGVAVNTTELVYQLDGDAALSPEEVSFNAEIFRVDGDFLAVNPLRSDGVRAMPILEGRFAVPVVSIHTLGDLLVPFRMQQIYAERAAAGGSGAWLVQRAIRSGAHCDFTTAEATSAFEAMVSWQESGAVPEGDDVLDPGVVADPSYGCAFTSETRVGLPACPAS